jgi:hypothetical protein
LYSPPPTKIAAAAKAVSGFSKTEFYPVLLNPNVFSEVNFVSGKVSATATD